MSLLATITWEDDANFTITLFINSFYLRVCLSNMGFNVSQIKCADCAAFSPHNGFVFLSLYVLFSHDKTIPSLQRYYIPFTSYHFLMKKFSKILNIP